MRHYGALIRRSWIGYCAALVAAAILLLGGIWVRWMAVSSPSVPSHFSTDISYRAGPLREPAYLLAALHALPSLDALAPDGLRFVAQPQLLECSYSVALHLKSGESAAHGLLIKTPCFGEGHARGGHFSFMLPAIVYRKLTGFIDGRLDGFNRNLEDTLCLDGTDIAVERIRGTRVDAGSTNCGEPYQAVGERVLEAIRPSLPPGLLPPPRRDWYPAGN